jgi:glycogen synthase
MNKTIARTRVLMLAWEYPPRIIGGLARVVYFLSRELAQQGMEVHVVTADHPGTAEYEIDEFGVHIHRVKNQVTVAGGVWVTEQNPDFRTFITRLNVGMLQHALRLHKERPFDIVHAHDWLVCDSAWVLKALGLPVIATIHATEAGRNRGVLDRVDSIYVGEVEARLTMEAEALIVNSSHMLSEVTTYFPVHADKVTIIPNGILPDRLACRIDRATLRQSYGVNDGPVILFVGRLVQEKGVQHLLKAAPKILKAHPRATFMIAGEGYYQGRLETLARRLEVERSVRFLGLANDKKLSELYAIADVAAVPSTYEPFGIVALEAMAARVPVVTSDAGGLKDIFRHRENGLVFKAGSAAKLGDGILLIWLPR